MVGHASSDRRGTRVGILEALMRPREVVVHEVVRDGGAQVSISRAALTPARRLCSALATTAAKSSWYDGNAVLLCWLSNFQSKGLASFNPRSNCRALCLPNRDSFTTRITGFLSALTAKPPSEASRLP